MSDLAFNERPVYYYDIMKKTKKPARAALPKTALARVCFIDRQIASGKFPNTKQLAEEWESVSISTISRDIEFMKNMLDAPIEYDAQHRGYYYAKKSYRIPMSFSGADELLALGMAKNILSLYKNTPIYNAAAHLLESITAPLAADSNTNWYENRIVIPQTPQASIPPDVWEPLTKALRENHIIVFDYMATYNDNYETRRVQPYQLLFDNGLWYLYGFAEERKATRMYSLSRMKNLVVLKEKFSLSQNFDYRKNNSGSYFGVFAGQKKQRFKIAFYDYSVLWVKDRKWADDQKIMETKDGIVISFTSSQFEKVLEWALSRGSTARPLEPASLVKEWKRNVYEMVKQ